ncbi:U3 small nucleolar RNA-associated protein 14 A-like protein, partial [Leptotrombidium deliense]
MKFKEKVLSSIEETQNKNEVELKDIDEELDEDLSTHNALLESVSKLNKRAKKKLRTEPSASISVNDLGKAHGKEGRLKLHELVKTVKDVSLRKQFQKVERKKLLKIPVTDPVAERITRATGYTEAKRHVSKWNSIVRANRNAEQLEFPLNEPTLRVESSQEFVSRFQPKTDLEKEVHELLNKSANNITSDRMLTEAEEKYLKAMNIEEARMRHKELQRMRALLSYQEAKMKRQSRIKSKKFHRIMKKDKLKQEMKKFEELKLTAPELAAKQLEGLDKLRALERASLKHKNTGKSAKQRLLRSKHDKNARDALAEQAEIAKQMTKKFVDKADNDSEDEKYFEEADEEEPNARQVLESEKKDEDKKIEESEGVSLDPRNFLTVKSTKLLSALPDFDENGINESELLVDDEEKEQRQLIKEAFAEDDVINDFKEEKMDTVEKEKAKDVNLYLPGWGQWGGAGISTDSKKKERFTRKAAKKKRKDSNLGNVIISEKKDDVIAKYMIKEIPFPFTSVSEFEKSIRHPIGHNWNPETAFKKIIEPKVVTKMGRIIEPMNEDMLIKYKKDKEAAMEAKT